MTTASPWASRWRGPAGGAQPPALRASASSAAPAARAEALRLSAIIPTLNAEPHLGDLPRAHEGRRRDPGRRRRFVRRDRADRARRARLVMAPKGGDAARGGAEAARATGCCSSTPTPCSGAAGARRWRQGGAHPDKAACFRFRLSESTGSGGRARSVAARVLFGRPRRPGAARPRGGSTTRPAWLSRPAAHGGCRLCPPHRPAPARCSARTPSPAARAGGATAGSAFGPQSRLPQASIGSACRPSGWRASTLTQDRPHRVEPCHQAPDRGLCGDQRRRGWCRSGGRASAGLRELDDQPPRRAGIGLELGDDLGHLRPARRLRASSHNR